MKTETKHQALENLPGQKSSDRYPQGLGDELFPVRETAVMKRLFKIGFQERFRRKEPNGLL
jgi:hypothetical protein